jgi:predicted alpha/beta superfamily hydrolase
MTSAAFIEWEENVKIMVRRKAKFVEDSRSFVGFIMDQIGPVIDRALRVNAEFNHVYATCDAAGL